MKGVTLVVSVLSFLAGATLTLAVLRGIEKGSPELAFVVGAILGTQLGAVVHHRQPGSTNALGEKLALGVALALTAVVFGLAAHLAVAPFTYPEISIPLAAVGSFVFPLVLFDTTWKALSKPEEK